MKKIICIIALSTLLFSLFLFRPVSDTAEARKLDPTPSYPGIAENSWSAGSEVDVDLVVNPAPSWLQLLTKATKLTTPVKICHEFRGGQFHWVGEIRQLKDGKWVKIPTVNAWVPNEEGLFMSCATPTEAGTFALFGYYNGPYEGPTTVPTTPVRYY